MTLSERMSSIQHPRSFSEALREEGQPDHTAARRSVPPDSPSSADPRPGLDEQLRHWARELEEVNRRQKEFLAVLGHELRNPLAVLRNVSEILLEGTGTVDLAWAAGVLDRQTRHLLCLAEELFDSARRDFGKGQLRRQPLDLARLVAAVVSDQRGLLEARGLTLTLEGTDQPVPIQGDPTSLTQVLTNLLHNAAKFTDPGGRVTVRLTRDAAHQRAVVTVRDTGVGIPAALLPRVFAPFFQVEPQRDRNRDGLGLGLALVKEWVERHGGGVRVASAGQGRGAEFAFWLPLAADAAWRAPAPPPPEEGGRWLHVLLIEDNPDAADCLRLLLERSGHRVSLAYHGADGVAIARRERPDVVLCDLHLPGMDGYAVARALRHDPRTAAAHLVAVSACDGDDDRRQCREAGFDRYLSKPLDVALLEDLLADLAAARHGDPV